MLLPLEEGAAHSIQITKLVVGGGRGGAGRRRNLMVVRSRSTRGRDSPQPWSGPHAWSSNGHDEQPHLSLHLLGAGWTNLSNIEITIFPSVRHNIPAFHAVLGVMSFHVPAKTSRPYGVGPCCSS